MDAVHEQFGRDFKKHRIAHGKTLRAFCREHGLDHGNLSKIERGVLPPPTGERLAEYLAYVGVEQGTDEWYRLCDLAAVCAGRIPDHVMSDEALVAKLPAVFKTLGRRRPTEHELDKLIDLIREA